MAADLIYRVFQIPEELRAAVNTTRANHHQTLKVFLASAIAEQLPALVQQLLEFLPALEGDRRPIRLPLCADLLEQLRQASEQTGLPSTRLLLTALLRASATTTPQKRKRAASTAGEETPKRRQKQNKGVAVLSSDEVAPEGVGPEAAETAAPAPVQRRRGRPRKVQTEPAGDSGTAPASDTFTTSARD